MRRLRDIIECCGTHDWSVPTVMDTSGTNLFKARIYVQVCTVCDLCHVMTRDHDPTTVNLTPTTKKQRHP